MYLEKSTRFFYAEMRKYYSWHLYKVPRYHDNVGKTFRNQFQISRGWKIPMLKAIRVDCYKNIKRHNLNINAQLKNYSTDKSHQNYDFSSTTLKIFAFIWKFSLLVSLALGTISNANYIEVKLLWQWTWFDVEVVVENIKV